MDDLSNIITTFVCIVLKHIGSCDYISDLKGKHFFWFARFDQLSKIYTIFDWTFALYLGYFDYILG
jgi:hypothetical protein